MRTGFRNSVPPVVCVSHNRAMTDALMITSSFLPGQGGIESYLDQLSVELAPDVAVMAAGRRGGSPIPEGLPYPTIGHTGSMLLPTRRLARAICAEAENLGTDRIIFGTPWPLLLLAPHLAATGLRYAVIVHGAELIAPGAVPLLRGKLGRALAGAELLLPVSHYTADKAAGLIRRAGLAIPPVEILRARVDLSKFSPDADAAAARTRIDCGETVPLILVFGRLVARKGVHRLIRALPEIEQRVPGTTLVVGGTGPEEKRLKRLAARTGGRVIFTGRVPHEEAPGLYAAANIFVLPVVDRWFGLEIEGLGVVLLEAQAAGTPCVTGRSGGTPEAVLNDQTGFVVDGRDRSALVEATTRLLSDRALAETMATAGREHVRAEFSERPLPEALRTWLS